MARVVIKGRQQLGKPFPAAGKKKRDEKVLAVKKRKRANKEKILKEKARRQIFLSRPSYGRHFGEATVLQRSFRFHHSTLNHISLFVLNGRAHPAGNEPLGGRHDDEVMNWVV